MMLIEWEGRVSADRSLDVQFAFYEECDDPLPRAGANYTRSGFDELLLRGEHRIATLLEHQAAVLAEPPPMRSS
jgi:hypothetical protein